MPVHGDLPLCRVKISATVCIQRTFAVPITLSCQPESHTKIYISGFSSRLDQISVSYIICGCCKNKIVHLSRNVHERQIPDYLGMISSIQIEIVERLHARVIQIDMDNSIIVIWEENP